MMIIIMIIVIVIMITSYRFFDYHKLGTNNH